MKHNGVIARKIETLDETVRKLTGLSALTTETLGQDFFLKRGVERSLQICVEAVIDIAHRLVSLHDRPPASSGGKALESLQSLGILKDASVYRRMVQFRNLVVHRYETVDDAILVDIVRNHLGEFAQFVREIQDYEDRSP